MENQTNDLSKALVIIQENLRKVAEDHTRKLWFQKGVFSLTETMRGDKAVDILSKDIIDFLATYVDAQVGTIYTTDDSVSTFQSAHGITGSPIQFINTGEGLVGQVVFGKKIKIIKNIPEDYFNIASSLGVTKPGSVVIVPAVLDNRTIAVFELGKLGSFADDEILFLEEIRESVAISINASLGKLKFEKLFDEIKENQRELSQQIDALNNAAIVSEADANGDITFVNEMFCHISEYTREELIGQNHRLLKSGKQTAGLFVGMWKAISMGKIWQGEIVNRKKSGGYYWVDTTIVPFKNADGTIYKYVSIRFDLTAKKELEIDLEEKLQERTQMLEQLSAQNKQLEDFNQIISHNLRGPLSNLLLLGNMIEGAPELEKKLLYIDKIKVVTHSLKETFEELVEATQIRIDKEISKDHIVLQDCLEKAMNALDGEITASLARITHDFSQAEQILYPKKYIDSIFYNLISNAIKYSSPGRTPEINVSSYKKDGWVYLEVSDNGLGIDLKKNGAHLFKLRKVFHNHPNAKGFGLFIKKTQIDSMGGQISAESEPGVGSKFTVKLLK